MKWDLEERTEDALAAYIEQGVSGSMRVYRAWEMEGSPQFPCVFVHAGRSGPVSDGAEWHDPRVIGVDVRIAVESAETTTNTAREENARARSDVLNVLCSSGLLAGMIAVGVEDVAFSMAQLDGEIERSVDGRVMITAATVAVIAEPVTGS